MAVIYDRDNNSYTHTSVPNNYSRGNPIPLDDSSVWLDETKAKEYAKNGATAYVGQQLTIINTETHAITVATISSIDGNLIELANRQELSSLNTKIGNLGPSDVGLGNVANVLQYSASNEPPYPISAITIDGLSESGTTIAKIKINDNAELSIKIPASNDYLAKDALNTLSGKWEDAYLSAQLLSNLTQAIPVNPQFTDTTYEPATSIAPGLLKIDSSISSNVGRIYPVITNKDKNAYVWVPWTDEGGGEILVDGTTISKDKDNKLYVVVGGISASLSTAMLPVFQVKGDYVTVTDNTLLSTAVETISNDYLKTTDKNNIIRDASISVYNLSTHTDATFSAITAKVDQNDENAQLSVNSLSVEIRSNYLTKLSDDTESTILSSQVSGLHTEEWTFYTDEHPEGIIKQIVVV